MALTPAIDDVNRTAQLKHKQENPAAWADWQLQEKMEAAELAKQGKPQEVKK